jgi:archaellum component FlaF (FlaF/FlaG flagellin family)
MRIKINNNILNKYNEFFGNIVQELNTNIKIINENYNAIIKLDYRGRESERWIGNHESRIASIEGYNLTNWSIDNSWNFTNSALKYSNYTHLSDDSSGNLTITSNGTLTLRSGTTGFTWNGTTLAVGNTKTVSAGTFNGTATKAKYADLAEYYQSDKEYTVGTILSFETDPEAEHEVCEYDPRKPLAGVVSEKPGFILNSEKGITENIVGETWVQLALVGRVKVRCNDIHEITKGLYLYPDTVNTGKAFASNTRIPELELIGVTISNKDLDTGLVLAKV